MSIHSRATAATTTTAHANQVDKSLDEALHHIDKLKEDMTHLCKDLDTLYNRRSFYEVAQPSLYLCQSNNSGQQPHFKSSTNSVNYAATTPYSSTSHLTFSCDRRVSNDFIIDLLQQYGRSTTTSTSTGAAIVTAAATGATAKTTQSTSTQTKCNRTTSYWNKNKKRLDRHQCWCHRRRLNNKWNISRQSRIFIIGSRV